MFNYRFALVLIASISLLACSSRTPQDSTLTSDEASSLWLADGSISISKKVPEVKSVEPAEVWGFMPFRKDVQKFVLDTKSKTLEITKNQNKESFEAKISSNIPKGQFKISLIDENPLWYASDNYFQERGLEVPAAGSKERYLKSVLGSRAIHLENGIILYSSKHKLPGAQFIQFGSNDFKKIQNAFNVGSLLEII